MKKLAGKVVFITGGASGLGRASALAAAEEGANVVIADLPGVHYTHVLHELKLAGAEASFVPVDVSDAAEVKAAVAATVKHFGRLDVALNNAGIGDFTPLLADLEEETFRHYINVDLNGVFYCMKYELQQMLQQGGGVIVNMSSIAGLRGVANSAAYSAAKHGVIGLTRSAAQEYGKKNIRVNAICPYFTQTPMVDALPAEMKEGMIRHTPMKRLGEAAEVARAFIFLACDDASYSNGTHLVLDGGFTA